MEIKDNERNGFKCPQQLKKKNVPEWKDEDPFNVH